MEHADDPPRQPQTVERDHDDGSPIDDDPLADFWHEFKPQPWVTHAACRGLDVNLFFEKKVPQALVDLCNQCPVRDQCLQWAIDNDERGFWGGMTRKDRKAISGPRPPKITSNSAKAQRERRRRRELKADPEAWAQFREQERERAREYRARKGEAA